MPRKCFICGSEDRLMEKYPKPPKEKEKRQKQVCSNERIYGACDNGKINSDHKIYASMAFMSHNEECPSGNFGDSLQLTYGFYILGQHIIGCQRFRIVFRVC